MSIAHVKPRNEMVTCPFNPSHRIDNGRMPIHLIKCRRNHDTSQFTNCPFNASHVIPFAEKSSHISMCPDKAIAERYMVNTLKPTINTLDQDLLSEIELPEASENWEAEVGPRSCAGYDPSKRTSEQTFQNPSTFSSMTKAQKKQFRQSQTVNGILGNQENDGDDKDEVDNLITAPLRQLRLPRENGSAAQSMQVLGGYNDVSSRAAVSRQSSARNCGNKTIGVENLLAISKGRGIYQFPDGRRPALPVPGLGAENEALKSKMRLPSSSGVSLANVGLPQPSASATDSCSTTSEESESVHLNRLQKRLEKKIKQINVLIEMQAKGATLNREELEKISKKGEILKVLDFLPRN